MKTSISLFLCSLVLSGCGGSSSDPQAPEAGDAGSVEAAPEDGDAAVDGTTPDIPSDDATPDAPLEDSDGPDAIGPDAGDAGPDAPSCDHPQEVLDFAESWAQTTCNSMGSCCSQAGLSFKPDECVDYYLQYLPYTIPCDVVFHPELVAGCLDQLEQWFGNCDRDINPDLWWALESNVNDACSRVLEGHGEPGDACTTSGDCRNPPEGGSVTCVWDGSDRYCQWMLPGEEGESCEFMSDEPVTTECFIADGLFCDIGDTQTCKPMGDAGEPCSKSFSPSCLNDIVCNKTTETCMHPLGPGEACNPTVIECAWDLYCAPSTNTCTARKTVGNQCGDDEECRTGRCVSGICSPYHHTMPLGYDVCG